MIKELFEKKYEKFREPGNEQSLGPPEGALPNATAVVLGPNEILQIGERLQQAATILQRKAKSKV